MHLNLDHIAVLVADLEVVAGALPESVEVFDVEAHPKEGTLERYARLGTRDDPALLLLQAAQPGPYTSALEKRGPGLHHLACVTDALGEAVRSFARHGLLLHPRSLDTLARREVWLCRPGVPFLVELSERPELRALEQQQLLVELPGESDPFDFLPNASVQSGSDDRIRLTLGAATCTLDPRATR